MVAAVAMTLVATAAIVATAATSAAAAADAYNETYAHESLYYAAAAYCVDALDKGNWTCPACRQRPALRVVTVLHGDGDTFGYVGVNNVTRRVVVAFAGTRAYNIPNWIANLKFWKAPFAPCRLAMGTECYIHRGFYSAFASVGENVTKAVLGALEDAPGGGSGYSVSVSGHSLGGALAMFAALDIISNVSMVSSGKVPLRLYTYGQPRCGDLSFAKYSDRIFSDYHEKYRLVHYADVVPHLPGAPLGFYHAAQEVWYSEDMKNYALGPPLLENECCMNSLWLPDSIADHIYYFGVRVGDQCGDSGRMPARVSKDVVLRLVYGVENEDVRHHHRRSRVSTAVHVV